MHAIEVRDKAIQLHNDGWPPSAIAENLGVTERTVRRWFAPVRSGMTPEQRAQQAKRLKAWRAAERATRLPDPIPGVLWLMGKGDLVMGATIVDHEDWKRLKDMRFSRGGMGYAQTTVDGHRISLHRLICGLEVGDSRVVDHVNRNPMDNRRANLRVGTQRENCANRGGFFAKAA